MEIGYSCVNLSKTHYLIDFCHEYFCCNTSDGWKEFQEIFTRKNDKKQTARLFQLLRNVRVCLVK